MYIQCVHAVLVALCINVYSLRNWHRDSWINFDVVRMLASMFHRLHIITTYIHNIEFIAQKQENESNLTITRSYTAQRTQHHGVHTKTEIKRTKRKGFSTWYKHFASTRLITTSTKIKHNNVKREKKITVK